MGIFSFISSLTAHIYLIYLRENITAEFHLISYLFIPAAILSMFLPNKFGKISDRHNKRKILFIGVFITGILYLLIPAMNNYYYFIGYKCHVLCPSSMGVGSRYCRRKSKR